MKSTTAAILMLLYVGSSHTQHGRGFGSTYSSIPLTKPSFNAEVNPTSRAERLEEHKIRHNLAKEMQRYMNLSADPCIDFYEYACGNWWRYHNELGTAQQIVEANIANQLQMLLTHPLPRQDQSPFSPSDIQKVRLFYNSCNNVNTNAAERRKFLMKIVKENGGLRNVPNSGWRHDSHWLQMLAELRRNYGLDILIGFDVDINLQQMSGNSIYLGEPKLTIIPPEYCSAIATRMANVRDEVYELIQQEVAANMKTWFGMESGEAERFGGDIVRFEFELCKHMREEQSLRPEPTSKRQQEPGFNTQSRSGQNRLRHTPKSNSLYPRKTLVELSAGLGNFIDFKLFVEQVVESSYTEYVYIRSYNYLTHLVRTSKSYNRYTISGYILYRALLELNYPPEDDSKLRSQHCIRLAMRLFPKMLGYMYQQHTHQDDVNRDLDQIFSEVAKALKQQLRMATWLSEPDRSTAISSLAQYVTMLADYQAVDLKDLQFQKGDDYWGMFETVMHYNAKQQLNRLRGSDLRHNTGSVDAFEVRAELVAKEHAIAVGLGLLQPPFYNYYFPRALKYALLGQRLAQTLLYAFDDEGWNKTPLTTASWNENTMESYSNATECFRTQYSNYLYNQPSEFYNATKLREIIADSSGLNVAFSAYLSWLQQMDHKLTVMLAKETLPSLNFTNTQLFFIYFAQTRCFARGNEEPALEFMPLAQHTPERWDVNGPLSNSIEFWKEFACAGGANMNNADKCLVY